MFSDLYQGVLLDNLINNAPLTDEFNVAPGAGAPIAPGLANSVETLAANSNSSFLNAFSSGGTLASIPASNPFFFAPELLLGRKPDRQPEISGVELRNPAGPAFQDLSLLSTTSAPTDTIC